MQAAQLIARAQTIRERLRNPSNAVPDSPITISRVSGIDGYEAARIAQKRRAERLKIVVDAHVAQLRERAKQPITIPTAPDESKIITLDSSVTIRDVQLEIARQWPIDFRDMISERRTHNIVVPRQIAMALARKLTTRSFPEIGRQFGGRDHSTILHAAQKYQWMLDLLSTDMQDGSSLAEWVRRAKYYYCVGKPA